MNFWKYPDPPFWEGETVFILGGGPSLDIPLEKIHDRKVIGINESFKLGSWVDVNYIGNNKYYAKNKADIAAYDGLTVCSGGKSTRDDNVLTVYASNEIMTMKPGRIGKSINSGIGAMNLALQFGAAEVVLIGFDMGVHNGQNWHNNNVTLNVYKKHIDEKYYAKVRRIIEERVMDVFDINGIDVINCTPDSKLTCFPRMTLDEYLGQESKFINDFLGEG